MITEATPASLFSVEEIISKINDSINKAKNLGENAQKVRAETFNFENEMKNLKNYLAVIWSESKISFIRNKLMQRGLFINTLEGFKEWITKANEEYDTQ